MTDQPDDPFEELLRAVDDPLPLDPAFDQRLWAELDASLRRRPTSFSEPVRDIDLDVDTIEPPTRWDADRRPAAGSRAVWLAAAAIALVLGIGALALSIGGDGDDVVVTNTPTTTLSPTEQIREACAAFRADTELETTALGDLSAALAEGKLDEAQIRAHIDTLDVPLAAFRQAVEEIRTDDNANDVDRTVVELGRIDAWLEQVSELDSPFDVDEASFLLTRLSWSILAANQPLAAVGAGGCLR